MEQVWWFWLLSFFANNDVETAKSVYEIQFFETHSQGTSFLADKDTDKLYYYYADSAICTNDDIANAYLDYSYTAYPSIQIAFKEEGKTKFEKATARNINKPLLIVLNGDLLMAPVVLDVIAGGNVTISGSFSTEEAQAIVAYLNGSANRPSNKDVQPLQAFDFKTTMPLLLDKALVEKDTAVLQVILADEVKMKHANGWAQNKSEILDDVISRKIGYNEIIETQSKYKPTSDSSVEVIRKLWVNGTVYGKPYEMQLNVEEQWVRRMGMWRLKVRIAVQSDKK